MVYLTMTPTIVEALQKLRGRGIHQHDEFEPSLRENVQPGTEAKESIQDKNNMGEKSGDINIENQHSPTEDIRSPPLTTASKLGREQLGKQLETTEPSLSAPAIGNPISHGQIIDLSRDMKAQGLQLYQLEALLKGSRVYIPPPPPKPEPTSEFKALMARLRREEEARSYERMTNPPPPMETFAQRFPAASAAHAFSSSYQSINASDPDDDGITYADVDRQMAMILNVLLSIVACAAAIWIAARWQSTPVRVALSMSGSVLVGIAEVVVYGGYLRRVGEAKSDEKGVVEVKEVIKTWVVGPDENMKDDGFQQPYIPIVSKLNEGPVRARLSSGKTA